MVMVMEVSDQGVRVTHGPRDMAHLPKTKLSGLKATIDLEDALLRTIIADYFVQRGYPITKENVRFGVTPGTNDGSYWTADKSWAKVDIQL
jgi:hypothetical protein